MAMQACIDMPRSASVAAIPPSHSRLAPNWPGYAAGSTTTEREQPVLPDDAGYTRCYWGARVVGCGVWGAERRSPAAVASKGVEETTRPTLTVTVTVVSSVKIESEIVPEQSPSRPLGHSPFPVSPLTADAATLQCGSRCRQKVPIPPTPHTHTPFVPLSPNIRNTIF